MEDENEYKKLPTEEKCVHKLWKARIAGYEEAIKLFNQIDDEKSPEWNKYLGLIKKFVTDSNAVAQEKGLEAALVFVENCGHAGKTTGEVMSGIVAKCIAAPKTKTKDLALQLTLMYIEIEKHEVVEEELLKGMEQKNPKVVAACIATLNHSLKQFGNKVIAIKPMVKKIPILLADRDKSVRDEMKALIVEMHRWIGAAIESHIATLQPVVQQELRESFSSSGRAQPVRYLRSQQHRVRDAPADSVVDGAEKDEDDDAGGGDSAELDPYELLDPVDILSKLPKDFYDKLEAKKWQDRKEALDVLENLLKTAPKLEPGDYADLVRALKKIISKDANVLLVALSGRLLAQVANGIRNKFQPYATACVQAILEKFKEKKAVVVTSLREAIDAIYPTTNLEAIMEDMLAAFDNKNPSIKAESSLFLARALCVTQPAAFNKKLIKAYVGGLLKLIESADLSVRDAAAEALGTATKLVGEKNIAPHIGKLDNLKEQKIKEFADKAEIKVKISAPKKEKPKGAALSGKGDSKPSGSAQPKPVKRPPTGKKLAPSKKATASRAPTTASRERELSQEEVDAAAETLFPADVINGLSDGNWKNRLSAVQSVHSTIQRLSSNDVSAQVLYRMLNKKPGLKDTNVQVMKARLEACKYITENFPISETAADVIIQDVVTKLAESSCGAISAYCLTYLAEGCGLEHVLMQGLTFAMDLQKNPKVQSEMFNWMANAIKEFGFTVNIKSIIAHSKKALSATNPNVRTSAVNFLGVVSLYVGPSLINQFDSEKPATKQLIGAEIDKYANSSPPSPTRKVGTVSKSSSKASVAEEIEEASEGALDEEVIIVDDNRPLTDIAPLMTDSLLEEITDKNWKVRDKGLEKLKAIISSSSPIKTSLGELPKSLLSRLVDSNSKLVQTALQICEQLAVAMGNKCKHHVRTFFPVFFQAFGDNKQWIRTAAVSCVETWCKEAGPHAPFEGEMVLDALKAGSPVLRATLLQWLADKLPDVPPKSFPREELAICVPVIYIFIEDRSAEVRRAAGECVLPFMLHLGYEAMHKQLDKVKPSSKSVIEAVLDNARPNLPVQPLPAAKGKKEEPRTVKSAGALKKESEKKVSAPSKGKVKPIPGNQRGRNDEDSTPLLPINNGKNQRIIDDQKLRALKWNFTTPREEFILLLKDQMATAGLNKQLLINMFHTDFRHHIKAIEALSLDLQDNGKSLVANLDLVLKWLTLRFFDTNPAVILKGLEYLSLVFQYLIEADYTMPEYEANCFIPYLVLKVGDPKDTVRSGVKALFKQICIVYSVTKLFGYLMEGLKSKNARQRAECLECIGHLVETYGSVVLSSGAGGGAALRELSRHIGDRDNSVRSAALNCVANVYFLEGEKVYKMIGQISDKDLSLLEERIKRAAKSRTSEERQGMIVPLSASGKPMQKSTACQPKEMESQRHRILVEDTEVTSGDEEEEEKPPEPVIQPSTPEPKVIPGPFGLDPDLVAKLDAATPTLKRTNVTEHDLAFLNEPIPLDAGRPRTAVGSQNIRPSMVTMRSPRSVPVPVPRSLIVSDSFAGIDDLQLADTIHSISSPDLTAAIRALSLISGALASGRGAALVSHEDRLMRAIAELMQHLRTAPPSASDNIFIGYKYLAQTLISFYETPECGSHVGEFTLSLVISEILKVLGANGKGAGEAEESEKLVRMLNNVCVRLLERSHKTSLLCALVSLLHESVGVSDAAYPRYQELLLKCLWKCLKLITTWEVNWLDYDAVLYKIHLFYKAYPNSFWKRSPDINDTPYRTIKTLVHTIVKKKGASITCHLTQIPDANESELYPYLLKIIKLLNLDDKRDPMDVGTVLTTVTGNNSALNAGRLPRAVHEELALILNQISMKEHNKEAMEKLFDLREQHPEVNIWTFMQGTTFFFRSYVENGLREVAEKRKLASMPVFTNNDYNTGIIDLTNENDEQLHLLHLEKLRALQAKAGLKTEPSTSQARTPMRDNRLFTESFNENTLPRPHSIDPQLELRTPQSVYPRDEAAVESLRRKLQQIKSSSKR